MIETLDADVRLKRGDAAGAVALLRSAQPRFPQERAIAPEVYRALDRARRRLESGDSDVAGIEREGLAALVKAGFRPDYFEVRMAGTLAKPHGQNVDVVVLTAARLGRARLIDNVQCRAAGEVGQSG